MIVTTKSSNLSEKKFSIREGRDDDYVFCYNLCKRNMESYFKQYYSGWNSRLYREAFDPKTIWIVEYLGRRIGFFNIEFQKKFSFIVDLQISTKYRNKGLATILVKYMETLTKNKGLYKICLEVFRSNHIAKAFYIGLSYKKIQDKGSTIVLEKRL